MNLHTRLSRLERAGAPDRVEPFAHLSDSQLTERIMDRLPALVTSWRMGPNRDRAGGLIRRLVGAALPRESLGRYPSTLETRAAVLALLSPSEASALGLSES